MPFNGQLCKDVDPSDSPAYARQHCSTAWCFRFC